MADHIEYWKRETHSNNWEGQSQGLLKKEQEISIAEGEETSNIEQVIKEDEKVSEAISALQVLGYSKREIIEALQTIEVTSLSVEDIIKKGLANLAKKL